MELGVLMVEIADSVFSRMRKKDLRLSSSGTPTPVHIWFPSMASVFPSLYGGGLSPHGPDFVYELRACAEQLPTINCSRGVKNAWLNAKWLARCNRALYRYKKLIAMSHSLGILAGVGSMFPPAPVARVCGVVALFLNYPGIFAGLLVLRFDMIKVVMRTYEFWYLSVMNMFSMALVAVHFSDTRALVLLPVALGFEITILIDASYRAVATTMRASLLTGLILFIFMVLSLFGFVDDSKNPPIFSYGTRTVSVVDGITNSLSTVVLMLWRNAARKYLVLSANRGRSSAVVRCITYHCPVRLCVSGTIDMATMKTTPSFRHILVRQSSSYRRLAAPMSQLTFAPTEDIFDPASTLFRSLYTPGFRPATRVVRAILQALLCLGIISTVLTFSVGPRSKSVFWNSIVSISSTIAFCATYAVHTQRKLLFLLCSSFDFAFFSVQVSIAHLCICDAMYWDVRCCAVLSSWLWVHWVLTSDTITPVMRLRLGYSRHAPHLVLILYVTAHVAVSLELIFWNHLQLQDRAIFSTAIRGHTIQLRVIPVLFGRMAITFSWSLRLLVRLSRRKSDELIMVQGNVLYHDYLRAKRSSTTLITTAAVSGDTA